MKQNRTLCFLAIIWVYLLASIVGVMVYNFLNFSFVIKLLIADIAATVVVFIFSLIFRNASTYDPYWSLQPIIISLLYYIQNHNSVVNLFALIVVLTWGIRLTLNWVYTFTDFTYQDWRYKMLTEKTKSFYPLINFFGIHMFPTLVVYFCILPVVYLSQYATNFNFITIIFFVCGLGCVLLQGISDYQMHKYQKHKTTPFIREGLWKYSRHPNYLAEILIWWVLGIMCVIALGGHYYLLFGALLNTLMFLCVSIPMADKRQGHKDNFLEYKKQTRMLLPIKK